MDLAAAGLKELPFTTHGKPLVTIPYAAHVTALSALEKARSAATGTAWLQGPALSGKTTVIRELYAAIADDCSIGVIDGANPDTDKLLDSLLSQFGYIVNCSSTSELLALLRVFALQQAASHKPPVIIVKASQRLRPASLRALNDLASLRVKQLAAVRLILVSDRPLGPVIGASEMDVPMLRGAVDCHLRPMRLSEASQYVHAKLRAAGSAVPECIFPDSVCAQLWRASGGWPGILDRLALLALAKTRHLPVAGSTIERPQLPGGTWETDQGPVLPTATSQTSTTPVLYISQGGELLKTVSLDQSRLLIGRSEHNDLAIDSRFISRHHALLVRNGEATLLVDLHSTNGSYVNSRRVSNHLVAHNDVIALGHHRIKFSDPFAKRRATIQGNEFADTVVMKTLDDMRAMLARENTDVMPPPSENVPTLNN